MPLIESESIVLNSLKLGESDRLVTFYSKKLGKIKAVAKGARKLKNKFGSSLEPFTYGRLVIYDKNSRFLYRLHQSDTIESFQILRSDYEKILESARFSICIDSLSPEGDPSVSVFNLFLNYLGRLKSERNTAGIIPLYQVKLLGYCGYAFCLERCVKCKGELSEVRMAPILGGMVCSGCFRSDPGNSFPVTPAAWAVLKQISKMNDDLLARIRPTSDVSGEIARLIDIFIFHLLGKKLPSLQNFGVGRSSGW
jgi:DNA repair protein RecO (recombination protein O)